MNLPLDLDELLSQLSCICYHDLKGCFILIALNSFDWICSHFVTRVPEVFVAILKQGCRVFVVLCTVHSPQTRPSCLMSQEITQMLIQAAQIYIFLSSCV